MKIIFLRLTFFRVGKVPTPRVGEPDSNPGPGANFFYLKLTQELPGSCLINLILKSLCKVHTSLAVTFSKGKATGSQQYESLASEPKMWGFEHM